MTRGTTSGGAGKDSDSSAPDPDLMFLMSWATHALAQEHAVALSALGISTRAYCVLERGAVGNLTQSQLGELCGIDKTTMVVTLDELERAGLAERRISQADRRARIVSVTSAGEAVVAKANAIVADLQNEILSTVPAGDRKTFLRVLSSLIDGRLSHLVQAERPARRRATQAA